MTNDGTFCGELVKDSPHLFGLLKRYLAHESAPIIFKAYEIGAACSGIEYRELHRESGVSFNPLCARVACLLISEEKMFDSAAIAASILISSSTPKERVALVENEKVTEIVQDYHLNRQGSPIIESIYFAVILDRVRHMHLLQISEKDKQQELELYALITPLQISEASRLATLLSASVDRARRTLI